MSKPLSHPDKALEKHLKEVAQKAVALFEDKNIFLPVPQPVFISLVYSLGALHDIGKATKYFQQYLQCHIDPGNCKPVKSNLKNHALPSAVFTLWYLKNYFKAPELDQFWSDIIPMFGYLAVRRHHGNLRNLDEEFFLDDNQKQTLKKQIASIDTKEISEILNAVLDTQPNWHDFIQYIDEDQFIDDLEDFAIRIVEFDDLEQNAKLEMFYLFALLYASLLLSDKQDVILDKDLQRSALNILEKISTFRQVSGFDTPKTEIDKLKNQAYFTTLENLEKIFNPDIHLYSISLPTGLGKTITSLAAAEKLKQLAGLSGSTIINIPFTSIIDQNFEVYHRIIRPSDTTALLKHHHLAEPEYKLQDETLRFEQSEFLIETWQAQTVVTTFVQLLEAILTTRKKDLLKVPSIVNSVVVLDEVQTIPYELWPTIRATFQTLGRLFNTYFVFVTATQPFIFKPSEEIFELVPNHTEYFKVFNRTKLIIQPETDFEGFKTDIINYIDANPQKNILIIVNTKKIAYTLFTSLSEQLPDNIDLLYLTTYITPYERKRIIDFVKTPSDRQKIIVSTQLVEAGVDISVHTVFRQIAPLDALIQSAGRANRYNEQSEPAEVYVYKITDQMQKTNLVYGTQLIQKTWDILKDKNTYYETEYLDLIQRYFKKVYNDLTKNITPRQLPNILALDFEKTNEFYLIEEKYKTESIFVLLNDNAKQVWERFVEIYSDDSIDLLKKRELFSKIKSQFYDYVVNVIIPYGSQAIDIDVAKEYGFYPVDPEISDYYSYDPEDFRRCRGYPAKGKQALFW